jgi:hypothetical protein
MDKYKDAEELSLSFDQELNDSEEFNYYKGLSLINLN